MRSARAALVAAVLCVSLAAVPCFGQDGWRIVLEHSSPIAEVPKVKPLQ